MNQSHRKPILHNGYVLEASTEVKRRIERVFFTEIYELSDGRYLYLFTNLNAKQIIDRHKKYNLKHIKLGSEKYFGLITDNYDLTDISNIIDQLTVLRGFDCVAGMDELKELLISDVIEPLLNPEKFEKFKLGVPNGILLFGPPGCGKTFIVNKLAEEIGYQLVEMNPSTVATPYVHGAVTNIAKYFKMAEMQSPSILFIDEFEGLMPKREDLGAHADTKKEEVNEFLVQLNKAGQKRILVVGATNRPDLIDTAILRSGRMDKKIYVPPPDFLARKEMFEIYLAGRPYDESIDFDKLGFITQNYVGSDIELIVTEAARMALKLNVESISEEHLMESIRNTPQSMSIEQLSFFNQFAQSDRW